MIKKYLFYIAYLPYIFKLNDGTDIAIIVTLTQIIPW